MGKRILVADDSLTIQQAFAMVMEGSGYTLSFAKSVDEAMSSAKSAGRPDLVVSDVALGSGSGYDLCAAIKADPLLRDVPVYILASSQTPYDDMRGRKVGADGHLAKPFESQALLDAVESALTMRPAALPQFPTDLDNTTRIASGDLPLDDDSYGEITIERGPAPTPAAWVAKPPTRPAPGLARPLPATGTPAPPARPSLIPGARPPAAAAQSGAIPIVRTGMTPQPSSSPLQQPAAGPATARPPLNRTMMGFPSVKPPVPGKSAAPVAPMPPAPSRPTPAGPMAAVPARPAAIPTPGTGVVSSSAKPMPSGPVATPAAPAALRPSLPRPAPSPALPEPLVGRRPATPPPPTVPMSAPVLSATPSAPATLTSAVDQAVGQKLAAIAARGPEYEAIAKLSREIIEQVVWEVVPELAETIIRQEIDRLASAKK